MQIADEDRPLVQRALDAPLPNRTDEELATYLSLIGSALAVLLPTTHTDTDQMEVAEILRNLARVQELEPFTIEEDGCHMRTSLNKLRQSVDPAVASTARTVFARICDLESTADSRSELDDWRTSAWSSLSHWKDPHSLDVPPTPSCFTRKRGRDDPE